MTFGEKIKKLRLERGLTQRQMAEALSITERNYQRYEATDSPSNETLLKLANFFDVSTDYLLGRSNENFYIPKFLFSDERFKDISATAKMLYAMLLINYGYTEYDLSKKLNTSLKVSKSLYTDKIREMLDLEAKGEEKIIKELEDKGLLEE